MLYHLDALVRELVVVRRADILPALPDNVKSRIVNFDVRSLQQPTDDDNLQVKMRLVLKDPDSPGAQAFFEVNMGLQPGENSINKIDLVLLFRTDSKNIEQTLVDMLSRAARYLAAYAIIYVMLADGVEIANKVLVR